MKPILLVLLALVTHSTAYDAVPEKTEGDFDAVWVWVRDEHDEPLPDAEIIAIAKFGDLAIGRTNEAGGYELRRISISSLGIISLAICHDRYHCGVVVRLQRDFGLYHRSGDSIVHALAPIMLGSH